MAEEKTVHLKAPYLIFLGDAVGDTYAKTGKGLKHWCPDKVAGQIRLPGCQVDLDLPDLSIAEARSAGVGSLIIGVAPIGGRLPDHWRNVILQAIDAGIDIVSGMHSRLHETAEFVEAAGRSGCRLVDVRSPPENIPIGSGDKRSGKRVLMVGTDCAVGKKYSALSLHDALARLGVAATFRATGQTGIMLAGEGIAIDAVVADFVSGAAELISPANDVDHWDVIEGQGSLFNPGYAAVSLGLTHGSQPDALVLCHDATRTEIEGWPAYPVPGFDQCMELNLLTARLTNPDVGFAGLCINTSGLPQSDRLAYLEHAAAETGLPCVDPVADGAEAIARFLIDNFQAKIKESRS